MGFLLRSGIESIGNGERETARRAEAGEFVCCICRRRRAAQTEMLERLAKVPISSLH